MTDDTEPDIAERTDPDGWTRYAFHEHGKCVVLTGRRVSGKGWHRWDWVSRVVVESEQMARNLVMG
jgi:hypothetical protein